MFHFCPDELMALQAMLPFAQDYINQAHGWLANLTGATCKHEHHCSSEAQEAVELDACAGVDTDQTTSFENPVVSTSYTS